MAWSSNVRYVIKELLALFKSADEFLWLVGASPIVGISNVPIEDFLEY